MASGYIILEDPAAIVVVNMPISIRIGSDAARVQANSWRSGLLDSEHPPVFADSVAIGHACDVVGNCLMLILSILYLV